MPETVPDRRLDPLETNDRGEGTAAVHALLGCDGGRQDGAGTGLVRGCKDTGNQRNGTGKIVSADEKRTACFRRGQCLDCDLVHHAQRTERTAHQFRQIIAGDILHHLAAGLERLGAAGHSLEAEKIVPCRSRSEAARTGNVGRDQPADRAPDTGLRLAKDACHARWLECQHLARSGKRVLDHIHRGPGAQRQHQLLGLIVDDARHAAGIKKMVIACDAAKMPLGAGTTQFQTLAVRRHLPDCLGSLAEIVDLVFRHVACPNNNRPRTAAGRDAAAFPCEHEGVPVRRNGEAAGTSCPGSEDAAGRRRISGAAAASGRPR